MKYPQPWQVWREKADPHTAFRILMRARFRDEELVIYTPQKGISAPIVDELSFFMERFEPQPKHHPHE